MRHLTLPFRILAALILALALPLKAQAQAREVKLPPDQVYTNGPSKFQFPPTIATFQRNASMVQYDPEAHDISVGYQEPPPGVAVTVFVYPVAPDAPTNKLEAHFESCKGEVLGRHTGSKLVGEGKIQIAPGSQKRDGLHATFDSTELFAGKVQPIKLELFLFTYHNAFILYRVTYPVPQQAAAEPAVKAFMQGLIWP